MDRAYSLLNIKAVNEDQRVIRGTATTPTPDRMGDVVEPLGVKFKNPLPLLHQHKSNLPVGTVRFNKPTKAGIDFEARLPFIAEPGPLKDRVDTAWGEVKAGLVSAVSIGFRATEFSHMDDGGIRFLETEVLELSLVTIPANADATIQLVKSIDSEALAASGQKAAPDKSSAGVTARSTAVKPKEGKMAKQTIGEQITANEATRAAKAAAMSEMLNKASEEDRTLDDEQSTEFKTLEDDVKRIDEHLVRLRSMEKLNIHTAKAVENVDTEKSASDNRAGVRVSVKSKNLLPGLGFTRYVAALARAQGNLVQAHAIAKSNEQWAAETPEVVEVLRTAVSAGTTTDATWAGPLVVYQNLQSEFVEYLRPLTIIGRIPGLRRVPFKVKIPRQTGAATVNWVGEGKVKPLTSIAFDTITMEFAKIAGIIPLTEELVRFSSPSAEQIVRDELASAIVQFMDNEFIDPSNASTDVSPAAITYGITPVTATGTTGAALRADVRTLMNSFLVLNMNLSDGVWIMTSQTALGISLMQNSLGQVEFPGVGVNGGTFMGLPVIVSENIPATGGSPSDGYPMVLVKAGDVLLADDGQVTVEASREASLQMDTSPDSPATASTTLVSLWQHNMVAIKAERYINWKLRRSTSVGFIQNAKYIE